MRSSRSRLQTRCRYAQQPGTRIAWDWRVESLPPRRAENSLPTHDDLSLAVEFDNGIDITFYRAALPVVLLSAAHVEARGIPRGIAFR